jgi:hypothetical protein
MADPQLFTLPSLATFTGLTGATVVVTNAISRAVNWNPAWFGLAVAAVLCFGMATITNPTLIEYLLALLNSCLVYVSAAGTSSVGAAAQGPARTDVAAEMPSQEGFFRRWM